jgi:hypothetical protein
MIGPQFMKIVIILSIAVHENKRIMPSYELKSETWFDLCFHKHLRYFLRDDFKVLVLCLLQIDYS